MAGAPEPIAIVGIGCRFAGVHDVASFWEVLRGGKETVGEYPGGRFEYLDQVYASDGPLAGKIATRRGGFLPDVDKFDPGFFEISLREAPLLDPQQRVLLEVAWEAIDDAGLRRDQLAGSQTGVFVGVWTSDYEASINEASDGGDLYATTGTGRYAASGRIAYVLDTRGPNLTVDTACSSSLVALHLACQSLLTGESEIALAGGVNVILRPEITLAYSAANMLSPDGRSKFGDASADGYVRSEGAGIVVLKTLSRAVADGDEIYAVVRGTAVNNDGRSSGLLLAPGQGGQKAVFEAGLRRAGVAPHEVDYVEAHGTGTLRGDPVELSTIGEVVGATTREHPCLVGSVKTNIGHTEGAAGVAAVIKVALALKHKTIPASLHFSKPTPLVDWDKYAIRVAAQTAPWPASGHTPNAAISSFGITGTNANAVLGAVPELVSQTAQSQTGRPLVFALSGQTQDALASVAQSWRDRMDNDAAWPASLVDLAYTSTVRRTQHDVRMAVVAETRDDLRTRLSSWIDDEAPLGVVSGQRLAETPRKAVFVYSGQGGQWTGMGRGLYAREPVFRNALDRCDVAIRAITGWSTVEMVLRDENVERMAEHDVVQPVLFALQYALTELWRSLGIEPAAVVGHSLGEVAAAAVAGALSLEDAAAVACHRSRLMKQVVGRGMMALVELPLDEMRQRIEGAENLWIGASNGATSTVVSGDIDAVESLLHALEAEEVFCRRVRTDVASHSGHMEEPRAELVEALRRIQPRRGSIPMYSTTTGEIEDGARLDAEYWGKNLRQPVLFYPAVQQLLADGFDTFVEVNVHPVLSHSVTDSLQRAERDAVVTVVMRRDTDEQLSLLSALSALHVAGYPIDWTRVNPKGAHMQLPTYPWQRERYWFEADGTPQRRQLDGNAVQGDGQVATDPGNSLYTLQWEDMMLHTPPPHGSEAPPGGARADAVQWIVLADEAFGRRFSSLVSAAGDTCVTVHAGDQARAVDASMYVVDPVNDEQLRAVLERYADRDVRIIHAWSTSESDAVPSIEALWEAQTRGTFSVGSVVRVLASLQRSRPTPLWIVTRGVQQIDANDPVAAPTHGGMLGIGRSIAQTHPEIPCVNLDLGCNATDDELQTAVRVMRDVARENTAEQQIAVRGTRALVARYRRALTRRPNAVDVRSDATYLFTGGLGGIGIGAARWLVARGARHLVLVGRKAPSAAAAAAITEMESQGAEIRVVSADIAEADAVAQLVENVQATMPRIAGVLHLAAIVEDALLPNANTEMYRRLMRPKMAGGWNLYQALENQPLDFWVSFSSIAAVVSQPGQGTYAAANAFLDGLARYATAKGMPMRSVQWGPWTGVGLSNEAGTQRSFAAYAAQGITEMALDFGLAILGEAMTREAPVMLGTPINVMKFLATSGDMPGAAEFRPLVPVVSAAAATARAQQGEAAPTTKGVAPAVPNIAERLAALAPGRARAVLLETHLREQLAAILKTSVARIDTQRPLGSLGIDSLMALELVRRLSSATGLKVPATAVFNYPTIAKLAAALEGRFAQQTPASSADSAATIGHGSNETPAGAQNGKTVGGATPSGSSTVSPSTGVPADVHEMSDEEALRALTGDFGASQ